MVEGTPLAVHRCRFLDFVPSAVTALAFPPLPLPSIKGKQKSTPTKEFKFGTLAIGRANGNIELCEWTGSDREHQAPQAWVVRKTLVGPYPSKVDSLAFTLRDRSALGDEEVPTLSQLRLFSTGGGSDLIEWDIERGCVQRTIGSQGGSIWSITPNPASNILALGCEDGSVRLLSIAYNTLTHLRRLDRVKARILSIAWGPPVPRETSQNKTQDTEDSDSDDEEDDWTDSWLVTGCSDSSLRKWDVASGRVTDRMTTDRVRGERTLVWTVGVLGDGTVVSGDSMGIVKFWDSRTCTQLHSFQAHAADVLCLTVSPEGAAVYTSGVDQKVVQFSYIKTSRPQNGSSSLLSRSPSRWVQSSTRRLHSHDVRALAIWPPHSPLPATHARQFPVNIAPILASGGLDMSVVLTPAALATSTIVKVTNPLATSTTATFGESYHMRLAYSSGPANTSAVRLAGQARLLVCPREAGITVWSVLPRKKVDEDDFEVDNQDGGWERVLDMDLNVQTNVVACAISDDGRWIAVSDWYDTKLFRLEVEKNGDLKPRRIRDFSAILKNPLPAAQASTGASSLCFTPDSSKLVIATSVTSFILVVDLGFGSSSPRVLRKFDHHRERDRVLGGRVVKGRKAKVVLDADELEAEPEETENPTDREMVAVWRMAVSPDGQWLATTDDHRQTHVFNLDSIQYHCALPSFSHPVHALAFDPSHPATLVLALANNTLQIYDVESRQFPRWARALSTTLPQRFTHLHDPVLGVTFDPGSRAGAEGTGAPARHALFWGSTWLCKVKLDEAAGWGGMNKKRRRDGKRAAPDARVEVSVEEGGKQSQQNFKLVTHYRPVLFVDFIAPGELVVVERPLVDVLAKMPPAYFKPKYGAS